MTDDDLDLQSFGSVREAIDDTPEEAANMRPRSELLTAVEHEVRSWGTTQAKAAERLGVT